MAELFEQGRDILEKSGVVAIMRRRAKRNGEYGVSGPVPISRGTEITGAALLLRKSGWGGVDPFEFYEGEQAAVYIEPGKQPEMTVRSVGKPLTVEKPAKGGWWRARGKIAREAEQALRERPARYRWYEGMYGEETDLK